MTTIFIGNLSFQVTESELERMFARYGRVSSVRMATDRATGSPRGFAFVQMPGTDDAEEAIARLNGQTLCGRPITVNEAHLKKAPRLARPIAGRRSALLDSL